MIVDVSNLPCRTAIKIVDYCIDKQIETHKCWRLINPNSLALTNDHYKLNISDEHVTYMILKGILE